MTPDRLRSAAPRLESVPTRTLLTRSLRKHGFKAFCSDEKPDYKKGSERASQLFVSAVLASLILYAVNYLRWSFWPAFGAVVGTLFLLVVAALILKANAKFIAYAYMVASAAALAYLLIKGHGNVALITHVLPLVILVAGRYGMRSFSSAAAFPLFVPLAIIVVLAPLLTEDPWRLATEAGPRLAWFAAAAVVPLLILLIRRMVRLPLEEVVARAIARITNDPGHASRVAVEIVKGRLGTGERLEYDDLAQRLQGSYGEEQLRRRADALLDGHSGKFRFNVAKHLLTIILGVSVLTFILVYILAWAGMPYDLAADWSESEVPRQQVDLLFAEVGLPTGPYIAVAVLFSIISTAGFLAFALTEEGHSAALRDEIAVERAKVFLLLTVPYDLVRRTGRLRVQPKTKPPDDSGLPLPNTPAIKGDRRRRQRR